MVLARWDMMTLSRVQETGGRRQEKLAGFAVISISCSPYHGQCGLGPPLFIVHEWSVHEGSIDLARRNP